VLLDRYPPYLPWFLLFVFSLRGVFCFWFIPLVWVSFYLNSDGPNKAQQLSPDRAYDLLLFLAGCE
jgi:hypothetical protein